MVRVMITSPVEAWLPSPSCTSRPSWAACRRRVLAGAPVEVGDEVAGGGEHDRVEPGGPVGYPGGERVLGGSSKITDMHTSVIKVERQRLGVAFAEGEGGCGFGGVGEAVEFGEVEGAVAVCDGAEDAAGADRGELLIIADQPDTRTTADRELDRGVEGEGVGHPGFVDDDQGRRPDRSGPVGQVAVLEGPGEFRQGVGADAGLLGEDRGRRGGGGEPDDLSAVLGPGQGEDAHGGGLAGAGRRDCQLHPCPGGAHLPDQGGLSGVEGGAVRR